jgi:hypothetical protein
MTDRTKIENPALGASSDAPGKSEAALFELGELVGTPAALAQLASIGYAPTRLIARHVAGDWGNVHPDDAQSNLDAVASGARILSEYSLPCGRIWVITEGNRSVTTILLPSEY